MQKIIPHLWYDKEAKQAAELYTSIFPDSRITNITTLHDTPSGDADTVSFELAGQPFMAISAGPYFKFTPAISFHVNCKTPEEVDELWKKLSEGGMVMMELGEYPFSKKFGWTTDKYGLSWQIGVSGNPSFTQKITPVLMYVGPVAGKAEEAINFYTSVFAEGNKDAPSKMNMAMRREKDEGPEKKGTLQYGSFTLMGQEFGAMDSALDHKFNFNEAVSLLVPCDTQDEIDFYWKKLSAVPESEQCGWLKDKYGVSWQIASSQMFEMMQKGTPEQVSRLTQTFLKMKKFNIAELKRAYEKA
jgi:predicted 3-demethylubiquinone-9 3-methyltransferase (glyoxalase superfamily)